MGGATALIEIDNLHFRYGGAEADALSGIDLNVDEGEFVAVVGPNGSGKSTLAKRLGGLEKRPEAGAWKCAHRTCSRPQAALPCAAT